MAFSDWGLTLERTDLYLKIIPTGTLIVTPSLHTVEVLEARTINHPF